MSLEEKAKVGKNGEILLDKPLREISGIKKGDIILIEALPGKLVINKIYFIDELLNMPTISEESAQEAEKNIQKEIKNQQRLTNEEH
jgi:bifunctional DNA-binding transcriptional regulator/antitoxin component of YhaV-PrlF toxin-antitoxin module